MSTQTKEKSQPITEEMGPTKPIKEHEWLKHFLGEWKTETEMDMGPDKPKVKVQGKESVKSLGGLWAFAQGDDKMPDGQPMQYYFALGYDVTFKEYRGCRFMNVSSHLWNYKGKLSADGKTLTLDCVGPNMMGEGTTNYRDIHEIIDDKHRTLRFLFEDENGKYKEMMRVEYTRTS